VQASFLTFCHPVKLFPQLRSTFCILQLERARTPIRHQSIDESALLSAAKTCKTLHSLVSLIELTRKQPKRETGSRVSFLTFRLATFSPTPSHHGPRTHTSIQLLDSTTLPSFCKTKPPIAFYVHTLNSCIYSYFVYDRTFFLFYRISDRVFWRSLQKRRSKQTLLSHSNRFKDDQPLPSFPQTL
jgi:hypothetical protein